uniref:Uncharacterized protein n=1 Tax=Anguilla anguilla TaxID=7936 RepID=A0A0E9QEQ5_ANGAN
MPLQPDNINNNTASYLPLPPSP